MMTFTSKTGDDYERHTAVRTITMEVAEGSSLSAVLEAFGQFLKATGYCFDGELDIVDDSDNEAKDD